MSAPFEEIAADAARLDEQPEFPIAAMAALTQLDTPDTREDEWALVRQVAKADGSVGRIFEGHLNGVERRGSPPTERALRPGGLQRLDSRVRGPAPSRATRRPQWDVAPRFWSTIGGHMLK